VSPAAPRTRAWTANGVSRLNQYRTKHDVYRRTRRDRRVIPSVHKVSRNARRGRPAQVPRAAAARGGLRAGRRARHGHAALGSHAFGPVLRRRAERFCALSELCVYRTSVT